MGKVSHPQAIGSGRTEGPVHQVCGLGTDTLY